MYAVYFFEVCIDDDPSVEFFCYLLSGVKPHLFFFLVGDEDELLYLFDEVVSVLLAHDEAITTLINDFAASCLVGSDDGAA